MSGFGCHFCGHTTTQVVDSRSRRTESGHSVQRSRLCSRCGRNFTTREYVFEGPHHHKLTKEEVARIRWLHNHTKPRPLQRELALQFGVTQSAITRILNGMRWPTDTTHA